MKLYDMALFDAPQVGANGQTLRSELVFCGNKWFDVERCIAGESGQLLLEYNANRRDCADETDPRTFAYWDALGMKKEIYTDESTGLGWVSYIPNAVLLPENADQLWPTVIFTNKIDVLSTEACSVIQECAKRNYIAVVLNFTYVDNEALLLTAPEAVCEKLPADPARLYATGFSYGSSRAEVLVLKQPEKFAAYAPTGCHMMGDLNFITDDEMENVRRIGIPTCIIDGLYETTQQFPLLRDIYEYHKPEQIRPYQIRDERGQLYCNFPKTGPGKVQRLRRRLYMSRCRDICYDDCVGASESADPVCRTLTAPFDRTQFRSIYGIDCYLGDYRDANGVYSLRLAGIDAMPHVMTPQLGVIMLDFFDRFRRDRETGKAVCLD